MFLPKTYKIFPLFKWKKPTEAALVICSMPIIISARSFVRDVSLRLQVGFKITSISSRHQIHSKTNMSSYHHTQ